MNKQTRVIAYHPEFRTLTGSTTAALLLSQFWYWSQNKLTIKRAGQFFKTQKETSQETGLSRSEYETALKRLEDQGIIEKELKSWPRKTWIKVNLKQLVTLLEGTGSTLVNAMTKVISSLENGVKKVSKAVSFPTPFKGKNDAKSMASKVIIETPDIQFSADDFSQCTGIVQNFVAWIERCEAENKKEVLVRLFRHKGLNHNYVKTCFNNHMKAVNDWLQKNPNTQNSQFIRDDLEAVTQQTWLQACKVKPGTINIAS